ncbi:MAG: hypothetical protein IPM53_18355 [Anaerolineaceae bacterium]|nr:hypothetical protein [Anaerolineaceae bacterium]
MKRIWTQWTILLVLLILVSGCGGNGRTTPTLPNTSTGDVDGPGGQAQILATQAAEVAAEQGDELATQAAATVAAQAEVLATQAADVIAEEGPVLATQAAELLEQGETAAETGTLPITVEPGSLAEKFATIPIPEGDGTVEVTITEAELNQAIAAAQAQTGTEPVLQNPQVRFSGGVIILTGTLAAPISGELTVSFAPYVVNNTLQFEVVEASIGNFQVPPAALQTAEQTLNSSLGTAMSQLPAGTGLQSVTVGEGTMTVVVVRL